MSCQHVFSLYLTQFSFSSANVPDCCSWNSRNTHLFLYLTPQPGCTDILDQSKSEGTLLDNVKLWETSWNIDGGGCLSVPLFSPISLCCHHNMCKNFALKASTELDSLVPCIFQTHNFWVYTLIGLILVWPQVLLLINFKFKFTSLKCTLDNAQVHHKQRFIYPTFINRSNYKNHSKTAVSSVLSLSAIPRSVCGLLLWN